MFKTWLMLCISTDPDKLKPIRTDPTQKLKLRATAFNINTLRVDESNADKIYRDRYVKSWRNDRFHDGCVGLVIHHVLMH